MSKLCFVSMVIHIKKRLLCLFYPTKAKITEKEIYSILTPKIELYKTK